jgi:predicted peptidase
MRRITLVPNWFTGVMLLAILLPGPMLGCRSGNSIARSTASFPAGTGFVRQDFVIDGESRPLWIFIPKNYDARNRYPAIVFLHGLFEAGAGGEQCLSAGLGPVIAKDPQHWPFITIFPQSHGTWKGPQREMLVIASLDYAESRWSIDSNRVILAGLSYGGLGTWEIGAKHPDRFAALVPVSGHRATELVERLILLPVWAFSFSGDPWVRSESSEVMCAEIKEHGGNARLTEFAGVGHDCWDRAVGESDLVNWMLEQRRPTVIPSPVARAGDSGRASTALAHVE